MKPLNVALVHANHPRLMDARMVGIWSYGVPEFRVKHFPVEDGYTIRRSDFKGYDLIFVEDSRAFGKIKRDYSIPVAYYVVDGNLSNEHYSKRLHHSGDADLVLVDWDDLTRYTMARRTVRRLSHCVNDRLFNPDYGEKTTDVGMYLNWNPERRRISRLVAEHCEQRGYSYKCGQRLGLYYPKSFARTRVTINVNRAGNIRSHRLFDAMACGTAVISSPNPPVAGEYRTPGRSYVEYWDDASLLTHLDNLISGERWQDVAIHGLRTINQYHTWAIRAQELRQMIYEVFSI